jgi:hypothetical protein
VACFSVSCRAISNSRNSLSLRAFSIRALSICSLSRCSNSEAGVTGGDAFVDGGGAAGSGGIAKAVAGACPADCGRCPNRKYPKTASTARKEKMPAAIASRLFMNVRARDERVAPLSLIVSPRPWSIELLAPCRAGHAWNQTRPQFFAMTTRCILAMLAFRRGVRSYVRPAAICSR